jgi:hypothetical protein
VARSITNWLIPGMDPVKLLLLTLVHFGPKVSAPSRARVQPKTNASFFMTPPVHESLN